MKRNLTIHLVLGLVVTGCGITARAQTTAVGPTAQPAALLLANGQVLQGNVALVGDRYHIGLPNGEIRLRASEVKCCCATLEEIYRWKRAGIHQGNVHDHLELAQWCQQQGLLGPAATELAWAIESDPRHPMIAVLSRRLQMATAAVPAESSPAESTPDLPSNAELDQLVREMPTGTVETFAQAIQPLLLNNCTTSGCHGPQSTAEFRLMRMPSGRSPSRRLTQRNLYAVLEYVDRNRPADSPLLESASQPHGKAEAPSFLNRESEQYRWLSEWVDALADKPAPTVPATVDTHVQPTLGPGAVEAAGFEFSTPPAAAAPDQPTEPIDDPFGPSEPQDLLPVEPTVQRGARLPQFVPADPFDPEIFNRRYFGAGK